MNRTYENSTEDSNPINFFVGTEVEKSPAYGLSTLFVVGLQSVTDIEEYLPPDIKHIYFGANMSFPIIDTNDYLIWSKWEKMIEEFLYRGYVCTLDIPLSCVEGLLESGLCEHHNFIPMISVKLPYLQQLGYNAIIKIDDKDFAASNPGVWCHYLHDLLDKDVFTNWNQYKKDLILK